jgi:hypothetical protein
MRLLIGSLLACASLVVGATACSSGESDKVSCVVKVGGAQTTVSLDTKVGASAVAIVGNYRVTFSILDGPTFEAEVRDADSTLMTMTAGGASGGGGSAGTPDGQLDFSCAP